MFDYTLHVEIKGVKSEKDSGQSNSNQSKSETGRVCVLYVCAQVRKGQCLWSAWLLYVSSQLYCIDTMKTRVCLAASLMRRGLG